MEKKTEQIPSLFDEFEKTTYSTIRDVCNVLNCPYGMPGWPDLFGEALTSYLQKNNAPKIRTLSLFSGAGGLDIGFHDLGFDIIESVEIESKFCNTLILNSGEGKMFASSQPKCIDIREYEGNNLGNIDFIIGGPPCQTFSAASRRHGGVLGTTDSRGVLFREYIRLLKKLQPRGFLFENVYGITGAQNGEAWAEIKSGFREVGYNLFYRILDAADYGVPQHRERLIIVGLKEGEFEFPRPTHGSDSINNEPFYSAGCAVKGLELTEEEKKVGISGRFGALINDIPPGLNYSFYTSELGHPHPIFAWRSKFSDFMYKADPDTPVRTIKAQGGQYTGPLHWDTRYFSYSEFKRLQTFPDNYTISGNKQTAVHQIGNSVPPQLARMMALAIRMQVFGTTFPFKLQLLPSEVELSFRKKKRELTKYYQTKAKEAICRLYADEVSKEYKDDNFFVTITDRFKYVLSNTEGAYKVSVKWMDKLLISVEPNSLKEKIEVSTISIFPKDSWNLPISSIELSVKSIDWATVSAAWRVLDRLLIVYHLKADLIQLNGYYQYESKLICKLSTKNLPCVNVFKPIIDGIVVGKNLTTEELSQFWKVETSDVITIGRELRRLGYEIRNSNTNPQMDENTWLLPYKFPTLQPESIQTYKSL